MSRSQRHETVAHPPLPTPSQCDGHTLPHHTSQIVAWRPRNDAAPSHSCHASCWGGRTSGKLQASGGNVTYTVVANGSVRDGTRIIISMTLREGRGEGVGEVGAWQFDGHRRQWHLRLKQ